jgi:hypothetical protein
MRPEGIEDWRFPTAVTSPAGSRGSGSTRKPVEVDGRQLGASWRHEA